MTRINSPLYKSVQFLKYSLLITVLYAIALFLMGLSFLKIHPTIGHKEFYYVFLFLSFIYFKGPSLFVLIGLSVLEDSFKTQLFGLTPLFYTGLYLSRHPIQKALGRLTFIKIWLLFTASLLLLRFPFVLLSTAHPYTASQTITLFYSFCTTVLLFPLLMKLLVPFLLNMREALYGPAR